MYLHIPPVEGIPAVDYSHLAEDSRWGLWSTPLVVGFRVRRTLVQIENPVSSGYLKAYVYVFSHVCTAV